MNEPDAVATGLCVDGPMAGDEVTVPLVDGEPPTVIDVNGSTYMLAVQPTPADRRPWRYTVVRLGDLIDPDG